MTKGIRSPFFSSNHRDKPVGKIVSLRVADGRVYILDEEWNLWSRPLHLVKTSTTSTAGDELERELQHILNPKKLACDTLLTNVAGYTGTSAPKRKKAVSMAFVNTVSKMDHCKVWRMPFAVPTAC